jgi:hypothetical protein
MLEFRKRITREMVRAEPDKIFVFGDNLERRGLGGQAKEMRGEPNAVGIVTKRRPSWDDDAFFADRPEEFRVLMRDLKLVASISQGKTIVWPEDGIGTGLANLEYQSPALFALINAFRNAMQITGQKEKLFGGPF